MRTSQPLSFFGSLFSKPASSTEPAISFPYTWETNPYKCQRTWPPDFEQLSPKHKFRLERRYRRRSKLKWARPQWSKATRIVQWGCIFAVGAYGFFGMEWDMPPDLKS